jgi:hypothetical protein
MPSRDKEFRAFLIAKLNVSPEKRLAAIAKITRKGLLMKLVIECDFLDMRLGAMKKLNTYDINKTTGEEHAFYLKLTMCEKVTEIRHIASQRLDPTDRNKLVSSPFADMRLTVAQMTSSRDILLRLVIDPDPQVSATAERSLKKKGLQESANPHSIN